MEFCNRCLLLLLYPIRILLFSETNKWRKLKLICLFLWGLFLGILFNRFFIQELKLPPLVEFYLSLSICIILAVGNTISVQIRCISLLVLPSFSGKSGRSVIKGIILSYLISGPIDNLINNGHEVVNVFACSSSLSYSLIKTKYDLMLQPFKEAVLGVKVDLGEIQQTSKVVQGIVDVIGKEIDKKQYDSAHLISSKKNNINSKTPPAKSKTIIENSLNVEIDKRYKKKIEDKCEKVISKADEKCRSVFSRGYDNCYDALSWVAAPLICLPLKVGIICNVAENLGGLAMCNATNKINHGLGESYINLLNMSDFLSNNLKPVDKYYKINKPSQIIDLHDAHETSNIILNKLAEKKSVLKHIFQIINTALSLLFLRVLLTSQTYHDDYLTKVDFDNIYITNYFIKIDQRRRELGKYTVLPLKKVEQKKFVNPNSFRSLQNEGRTFFIQTVKLLLEMITVTIFVLLDRLFYEALYVVRRHAIIEYVQEGKHTMNLEIKGTGMFAKLVRSVLKGFNITKSIKTTKTNTKCLPLPTQMPEAILYKIYRGYSLLFSLILLDVLTKRLYRIFCAYFYPKREKYRILYIYNAFLMERRRFLSSTRERVKIIRDERQLEMDHNMLRLFRMKYPKTFGWLRVFETYRKRCFLCSELVHLFDWQMKLFHECVSPGCHFVYCDQCWAEIGEFCFACEQLSEVSHSHTDIVSEE